MAGRAIRMEKCMPEAGLAKAGPAVLPAEPGEALAAVAGANAGHFPRRGLAFLGSTTTERCGPSPVLSVLSSG